MKPVNGVVVKKYISHGMMLVPVGKVLVPQFYTNYVLTLDTSKQVIVSRREYLSTKVGDTYSGMENEWWETTLMVLGIVAVIIGGAIGLIWLLNVLFPVY